MDVLNTPSINKYIKDFTSDHFYLKIWYKERNQKRMWKELLSTIGPFIRGKIRRVLHETCPKRDENCPV